MGRGAIGNWPGAPRVSNSSSPACIDVPPKRCEVHWSSLRIADELGEDIVARLHAAQCERAVFEERPQ